MLLDTGNVDKLYWIFEYGKVFCGYLFLMFLWPSVVFGWHLRKKAKSYRFAFCVTVPIVIINTAVLFLGLFHLLDRRIICLLFYGTFIAALVRHMMAYVHPRAWRKKEGKLFAAPASAREHKGKIRIIPFLEKYSLLMIVLIWGMIYFSYGAFQIHSYGYGDLYVHHEWIQGLVEGNVFSAGVYPEAMHCFIYCMSMLFNIRVFSILLFLQGIHVAVFLTAVYCLLRKVFRWRYTPVFVLALFLTIDLTNADLIHSMFRLQITMPMEFGLHTICLCALYLTNYLNRNRINPREEKKAKFYWDEDLFLFMMSLTASLMIHFHVVIMAFIVCVAFTVFALKKILNYKYLVPLLTSVLCACLVAVTPMAGALKQGIPFHESIYWAIEAMGGNETHQTDEEGGEKTDTEEAKEGLPNIELKEIPAVSYIRELLIKIYEKGYIALYGTGRARWICILTVMGAVFCLLARRIRCFQSMLEICSGYPPVIAASILYVVVYAAPALGLPDIIPEGRFFAPGHMLLLAVTAMPLDVAVSRLAGICSHWILWGMSYASVAGIYAAAMMLGSFRGFLFYEMTRYNSVVEVTNSIIETYPQKSYTIVSPTDELYQVIQDGWHEELLSFMEKCSSGEEYTIPSEYVFLYVEKKPILYAQAHFFRGPWWLADEKYQTPYWETYSLKYPDSGTSQSPEIIATEILEDEAAKDIPEYYIAWDTYLKLDRRTILESKAYEWCERFSKKYPFVLKVYYEDDDFVCYYFRQDVNDTLYNLGME